MSNQIYLDPVKIDFLRPRSFRGGPYGFQLGDGYNSTFCNDLEEMPDDDVECIEIAYDVFCGENEDKVAIAIFDYILEHESDIYVGNNYYSFEKFKHIFPENEGKRQW